MFGCCSRATASASLRKRAQLVRPGVAAGQDHLQGHDPVQLQVPRLVDDAHAAPAQLAQDLVAGDGRRAGRGRLRPGRDRHRHRRCRIVLAGRALYGVGRLTRGRGGEQRFRHRRGTGSFWRDEACGSLDMATLQARRIWTRERQRGSETQRRSGVFHRIESRHFGFRPLGSRRCVPLHSDLP